MASRVFTHFGEVADFLWQNAERLRGAYKPNEYDKVVLPLLVIRRLDCVLAPTKAKVEKEWAKLEAQGRALDDGLVVAKLKKASGLDFFNTSPFDFERLKDDPTHLAANMRAYLRAFSPNARDVLEHFKFDAQIGRLHDTDLLYQVVELFASVELHPDSLSNHDMGKVFEELIRRFNEKKNEEAGDHYTPREVIQLMVDLLFVEDGDVLAGTGVTRTLYDPACGTGGMLSVAEEYLHELNPSAQLFVHGQELNGESYAICKADMLIKGHDAEQIAHGNSFSKDGHDGKKFDYFLSNPPFGVDWKNVRKVVEDEHEQRGHAGRFGPGLPRINDGALLFLMHMVEKWKPYDAKTGEGGSRLAIVLNGSPLFTGDAGSGESEIRRWVLENDWVEAIVALPDQLFYNTGIHTYVWVLSNRKPAHRKGKVQLVDGTKHFQKMRRSLGNKRNELSDEHIAELVGVFGDMAESDISKVFDNEDFGYRKITIERPLRLSFQVSEERLIALRESKSFVALGASRKKGAAGEAEVEEGRALQRRLMDCLEGMDRERVWRSRTEFEGDLEEALKGAELKLKAPVRKAVLAALGERDEEAEVCRDRKGRVEPDTQLRDSENVPLSEDVAAYFEREIRPHVPDAWIAGIELGEDGGWEVVDESKVRIGYEIPVTRHFYKYEPLRELSVIEGEIKALEADIQGMVGGLVG